MGLQTFRGKSGDPLGLRYQIRKQKEEREKSKKRTPLTIVIMEKYMSP